MPKNPDLHKGHRQRLLKKYLENGIQSLEEHEILEILLFFAFSRCNTNEISHELINRFGSITQVFNASIDEMVKVEGIGGTSAALLRFLGDFIDLIGVSNAPSINLDSFESIKMFCEKRLPNDGNEICHFILLDKRNYFITCISMTVCEFSLVNIDMRSVIMKALNVNASSVIIIHNHPQVTAATASNSDLKFTRKISELLSTVGIGITDHIIIGNNDYFSIRQSDLLDDLWS